MTRLMAALLAASLLLPATARAQEGDGGDGGNGGEGEGGPVAQPSDRPWTPEELAEVEELEGDFEVYKRAANRHEHRIQAILYREYMERKAKLEGRYRERVANTTAAHRERIGEAIALLEEFLRKYPNHESYTPDAMFRLADLYIDQAEIAYEQKLELQMAGIKDGTAPEPEPEPEEPLDADAPIPYDGPDYEPAMALWRGIVERFPEYRQIDGTLYLLGYYLGQIGRERESKQVYLGLVCANKYKPLDQPPPALTREEIRAKIETKTEFHGYDDCESRSDLPELVQEAWVRGIGDAHFNAAGELAEAIASYRKVATDKESKYYDEALYKLAWSYYRNDDFELGIKAFDESVVYSDKREAEGEPALDLRGEAITYIAISFTDPWSVEEQVDPARSFDRATAFYQGRMDERHVRDVFEELGNTFKVIEAYEQAIDSWRIVVTKWPLHPKAPVVHQKIVSAFEQMGEKDLADEEAAKLAQLYAKGTEWYKANETNREAMDAQARISQRMLRATAENTHRAAQLARKDWEASQDPGDKQKFIDLYAKAAELYTLYLETYPDSPEIYEFTYRIADTKFFSEQYIESVPHYRWVRDHRELSGEYYLKAALSIVQAYQAEVDQRLKAGELTEPPVPTAEQLKAMGQVQPMNIPSVYKDLQDAYDEYQQLVDDPKTAPTMALAAALVSYRHLHLDDAIERFEVVMDRFCGSEADAVAQAKDGLLVIYEYRKELDKFKAVNQKFISGSCGDEEAIALAKSQNRSIKFQEAENYFTEKNYEEAAIRFYRFYKTAPDDDPNLPIALYNSAISYERSGRPKTAIYLFEEFTNNPSKQFRDSEYYVEALYLTAVAHQKAFDYQAAVDKYLEVVKVASEKGRTDPPGQRTLKQIRLDALFNAALLRELDRVYKDPRNERGTGAISLYRRYYKLEEDRRKKDRALWAIARVYESMRDQRNMVKTYDEWRKKYGRDAGNEQDYVFTYYNTVQMYEKKGVKDRTLNKVRKQVVDAWETVGKPTGTPTAEMAAEQEFYFAEKYYQGTVEPYKFRWPKAADNAKKVEATLNKFDKVTENGREKFKEIGKYQSNKFGAGAIVRIGDIEFFAAQKLINAPAPKKILRLDEKYPDKGILNTWQARIEGIVEPRSAFAIEQWTKVVETAKSVGTSNKWTKLALERLHDFDNPEMWPVLREDEIGTVENP